MAIPLLGPAQSISKTTLDNSGYDRRLSDPGGCQTSSRRSSTGNQQWLTRARGCYFSRFDRSLHQRRDREGRPCAHNQRTRSKSHQQTHLSQVGQFPARGSQTVSCSGLAPTIAYGPKDQRPYSESHVPHLREGHALGTDSVGAQPHGLSRTQRSQQASKTSSHFDRRGVWISARSTGPSLSLYGPFGGLHWPSYQRGDGPALESDRLRKLSHGNQRRFCSQPGDEAQVRVLPGPIASRPGRRDHFARMEAIVSGYGRELGFPQPADSETLRFWLAAEEGASCRGVTSEDSGTHRLAYVSSQLSCLARRNGCSTRRTAETHAPCQHLNHDERLWRSLHGIEAQSQHIRRAARVGSRPHQIAKGRHVDGLCSGVLNLIGPFQTTIEKS